MTDELQTEVADNHSNSTVISKKFTFAKFSLVFVGLFILSIVVCEVLGWPFLKEPVERFASKQLERTVRIDAPFKLKLLGGVKLEVGGLFISAPKAFDIPHFIETKNITLNLRYSDLFKFKNSNQLRIKSLRVNQIDAQLLRREDGSTTWQFSDDKTKPDSPFPIIEILIVQNGAAKITDPQTQVDLVAKFHTDEGLSNKVANSTIEIEGKLLKKSIKGKLITDGFLPIATNDSDASPIASKAWLEYSTLRADFAGTVSDLLGKHNVKGKLSVKGPSLSILGNLVNVVLPTTDKFSLNTLLENDGEVWLANAVSAHVGKSDLNGNFSYDPRPARPLLKGNISGKHFFLADLAPAFGTKNADGSMATPSNGKVLPDRPLDLPSLNKMDAQIDVNLTYVDLGNAFSRPISPLKADLLLENGKLSLSKIDARTADGSIAGLISIDTHLAKATTLASTADVLKAESKAVSLPTWNINLRWKDIDVEKWLTVSTDPKKQAKSEGKKETPPSYVTGTLNGKTKLTGRGNSTAEMLSSLDGDVSIFINKGTISHLIIEAVGLDIAQGLGILLTKDNALPMNCAVMDLSTKNGLATPKMALVDTPVTLILIDGNVNIAKEALDLRMVAKPKNISPFTVRSPIHVKGTFKNPDVSIEKTPIVARILGSVALALIAPPAAILPFLDAGSGKKSPCDQSLAEFNEKP
ncbi:AsmA family protein [Methylotenera sp.]|uniref:AsmA family protein n=1 Tax=Methylotenera sp. TaxID=2051956 RepID=UPI00248A52E0|nr:AsmA family protein [Methylotenera sp.]MDI1299404.1 AsmA family protein [Methylotenera sp.]